MASTLRTIQTPLGKSDRPPLPITFEPVLLAWMAEARYQVSDASWSAGLFRFLLRERDVLYFIGSRSYIAAGTGKRYDV